MQDYASNDTFLVIHFMFQSILELKIRGGRGAKKCHIFFEWPLKCIYVYKNTTTKKNPGKCAFARGLKLLGCSTKHLSLRLCIQEVRI